MKRAQTPARNAEDMSIARRPSGDVSLPSGCGTRMAALAWASGIGLLLAPGFVSGTKALGQPPQFARGPQSGSAAGSQDPAEASTYSAAISQPNPDVRASALQQFLVNYPNSNLRQQAIAQMMMAKRQTRYAGAPAAINRPMTSSAAMESSAPAQAAEPAPVAETPAAPTVAMTPRDSLLQQTAKHAEVSVAPHSLTIKADNSALSQILHDVSGSTGMTVEGLTGKDDRVFGNYGPGDAREVLLALLAGSGYNVMMLGETATGAPRELSLTPRSSSGAGSSTPGGSMVRNNTNDAVMTASEDDEDADQDVQQTQPEPVQPMAQPQPIPGNQPGSEGTLPRSQQEIQQEIQRLRQQQLPN